MMWILGCTYPPIDLEGRGPPCGPGYVASGERCVPIGGLDASTDVTTDANIDVAVTCSRYACVAGELTCDGGPSAVSVCEGDELVLCVGDEVTRLPCPSGCVEAGDAAACDFSPSYAACEVPFGEADVTIAAGETWDIDAESDTSDRPGVVVERVLQRVGLPSLRVLSMRSLVVEEGGAIRIAPSLVMRSEAGIEIANPPAVVLLVETTVVIRGRVDASAHGGLGGAGAVRACCDVAPCTFEGCGVAGLDSDFDDGGGGGGGHGGRGGDGGPPQYCYTCDDCPCDGPVGPYSRGGLPHGAPALPELVGGAPGGFGGLAGGFDEMGRCTATRSLGGGGGGAVVIAAGTSIVVARSGVIAAHGGGGGHGDWENSGGGGGAGGAIVIEAPYVSLAGLLTAQGGAGGTAGSCNACNASMCAPLDGFAPDGDDDGSVVGTEPLPGTLLGGRGGMGSGLSADGGSVPRNTAGGDSGGGGGGGGRIRISSLLPDTVDAASRTTPVGASLSLAEGLGCAP